MSAAGDGPRSALPGSVSAARDRVLIMGAAGRDVHNFDAVFRGADIVLSATPIDLAHVLRVSKPITRVRYDLVQVAGPSLGELIEPIVAQARAPVPAGS